MVGARGFEPPAPCSQSKYSTRLSYAPNFELLSQPSFFFARCRRHLFSHFAIKSLRASVSGGKRLPLGQKAKQFAFCFPLRAQSKYSTRLSYAPNFELLSQLSTLSKKAPLKTQFESGAEDETRTHDIWYHKPAL